MKKLLCTALSAVVCAGIGAKDRVTHNPDFTNTETILHAWSWNFPTMAQNMKKIADAGFTMIQTSPVQQCFDPEGGSKKLFDETGKEGFWYYYYQPIDWKIGNQILGTRQQMKEMMDSAIKYDIRVIVDVLPNHTAFDIDAVSDDMVRAVGGRHKLYHSQGLTPVNDYNDRMQCTLWGSGALPDVNTENPDFQKYYMQFVNELLALGVRGFRYDTAKHIGVHSDPVDEGLSSRSLMTACLYMVKCFRTVMSLKLNMPTISARPLRGMDMYCVKCYRKRARQKLIFQIGAISLPRNILRHGLRAMIHIAMHMRAQV